MELEELWHAIKVNIDEAVDVGTTLKLGDVRRAHASLNQRIDIASRLANMKIFARIGYVAVIRLERAVVADDIAAVAAESSPGRSGKSTTAGVDRSARRAEERALEHDGTTRTAAAVTTIAAASTIAAITPCTAGPSCTTISTHAQRRCFASKPRETRNTGGARSRKAACGSRDPRRAANVHRAGKVDAALGCDLDSAAAGATSSRTNSLASAAAKSPLATSPAESAVSTTFKNYCNGDCTT